MTGRELIIFILNHNLEDETIILNKDFMRYFSENFDGLMTEEEAALKFGVGVATIRTWYSCDMVDGIRIGENVYISKQSTQPAGICKECGRVRYFQCNRKGNN